ncbi:hypothetical protein F4054_20960 [Candidatus Poribacteria bacterium]|nr:hypothetical protein [Candidatus Poribacteria bacterium]
MCKDFVNYCLNAGRLWVCTPPRISWIPWIRKYVPQANSLCYTGYVPQANSLCYTGYVPQTNSLCYSRYAPQTNSLCYKVALLSIARQKLYTLKPNIPA